MKELNISEVFCEILSGVVVLLVVAPLLHLSGVVSVDKAVDVLTATFSVAHVAGALVLAYLLGLVMDAVGLAVGEWCLDAMVDDGTLSPEERSRFWINVPEHVLKYRVVQWSYYSTYRNLFLLLIPGTSLWTVVASEKRGLCGGVVVLAGGMVLEVVLWKAMTVLLGIYFRLGKYAYISKAPGASAAAG